MKRILSVLFALLLVIGVLFSVPMNISAESTATEDGLTVTITTDKEEYAQDEEIQVVISITNNNSYRVEDISVETLLPEGLVLKNGSLSMEKIAIRAGETYTVSVIAQLSKELWEEVIDPDNPTTPGSTDATQNGSGNNLIWWIAGAVGAVLAIAVATILVIKNKKATKVISLFLCLLMIASILPMGVFADLVATQIKVDKTIIVQGNEYTIESTVVKPININPEENDVFIVTFNINDGTNGTYQVQNVSNGNKAIIPDAPERIGYVFTGWYVESECTTSFDFSTLISQNITLYAGWRMEEGGDPSSASSSGGGTIFSISGIEMEDNTVKVTINANNSCVLFVYFLDENTDSVITTVSTQTPAYCEMTEISIPVGTALPEKFVIIAKLLDFNGEELCNQFTSIEYTTAYENYAKQTIHDFEDKTVINFDEDETKNFGVLSDDIKEITVGEYTNKLSVYSQPIVSVNDDSEDDETLEIEYERYYVFKNPDESVRSLVVGDKIYIPETNDLFKIGNIEISIDGDVILYASDDVELSDFYDMLNIDMEMDCDELDEVEDTPSLMSTILDTTTSKGLDFSIEYTPRDWLKIKGTLNMTIKSTVKVVYDIKWFAEDYYYISVITEAKHTFAIEVKVTLNNDDAVQAEKKEATLEIPLGKVTVPTSVPGLTFSITPSIPFEVELSGGLNFEVTYQTKSGFTYTSYDGRQNIDKKSHNVKFGVEAGLEIKFGPKIEVALEFCKSVFKAKLIIAAGVYFNAEWDIWDVESSSGSKHACSICLEGDAGIYIEIKAGLTYRIIKNILEGNLGMWTIIKKDVSIGDFHVSLLNDRLSLYEGRVTFGWGDCENYAYKTQFEVKDRDGNIIPNATITIKTADGETVDTISSNETKYLHNGSYKVIANVDGVEAMQDFTIYLGGRTVTLELNSQGTLSGKICKASDRVTAIPNATIQIYRNGVLYTTKSSNNTGNYTINLPAGQYFVVISCDGYINFSSNATVVADQNTYMETFLMIQGEEGDEGIASGKVVNSLTGQGAPNVSLVILKNWHSTTDDGEVVGTTTTDSNGNYSIELPIGNYTVVASKENFTSNSFNIIVQNGTTSDQNGTITPVLGEGSGDNYLITLTWGASPSDLDSHLYGTTGYGNTFHVYYSDKTYYYGGDTICNLDYDDTSSYGPEHVTLTVDDDGVYYYYIHNFSSNYGMTSSGAKITVERGNTTVAVFNVPTDLSDARYWNVFAIKDGRLIISNTITSSPDTSYAD